MTSVYSIVSIGFMICVLSKYNQSVALKVDVTKETNAFTEARSNIEKMRNQSCDVPIPKLFVVNKFYPLPNGRYWPHCVILHRCDKDAGCCGTDDKVCAKQDSQIVHLHIIALQHRQKQAVFKMSFENHTSCSCQSIRDLQTTPEVYQIS
ncbi:uncharacterized protein LOC129218855 [Uloborus diversus]|uniref:uncharacterized protein LOC129218855 n=1 Tax=Uloborus diversus TaxID=327109 RepID=UPI002409B43E|nr:uncharacterized protein LOC129218855 [Uloborus diversus]